MLADQMTTKQCYKKQTKNKWATDTMWWSHGIDGKDKKGNVVVDDI